MIAMVGKIIKAFESISVVARRVIKGGVSSAIVLMTFACFYITSPSRTLGEIYLAKGLCTVSVTIFAEAVVLSLLAEIFAARRGKKE